MMTIERCHADLKAVVDAVEIYSPTQYALWGERRDFSGFLAPASPPGTPSMIDPAASPPGDVAGATTPVFLPFLEGDLYGRLYVRPSSAGVRPNDMLAQRDHISALSAANNGCGTWEPGWRIVALDDDGRVAVAREQVTFWVPPAGLRTRSGQARPGDFCRVWVTKELRQLVPGFYFAVGNGDGHDQRDMVDPLVRLYWHLTVDVAATYMAHTTALFNHAGIPFRTKVVADPGGYVRADAGVLYLERRYFRAARTIIMKIHQAVQMGLRPDVPMFTKPLAPGLGLAEDPNNGMSFGQSRCKIAAEALWSSFAQGLTDPDARLSALARAFRQAGLDPELPFLERGSADSYDLSLEPAARKAIQRAATPRREPRRVRKQKRSAVSV